MVHDEGMILMLLFAAVVIVYLIMSDYGGDY